MSFEEDRCVCCGRKAELNEDGECASCKADLEYSCEDASLQETTMTAQQMKRLKKALTDFHRVTEAEARIQELIEEGLEIEQRQETTS